MKGSWTPITLSFLLLLFIYSSHDVFAAPTGHLCRPEQRDALLEFKNEFEIGKPNFVCPTSGFHPKTQSWKSNSDCCNWEGITCNAKSGEVMGLNLTCSCLQGQFHSNSSLQNLRFLTTLYLSYNDISGQIPSSIGNLSHLTTLYLSFNQFSGQIPSSIGNLYKLTSLSLSFNQFSGQIPSSIGNLYKLTSLSLSGNSFTGEIPSSFGNLNQLFYFDVFSNQLSGSFPIALLNLTKLVYLSLQGNQFTGTLPPNFTSLSNLGSFDASDNAFTGAIPSSLFTIPSLNYARLDNNQFNGTLEFGNSSSPSKLQALHLGDNNFRGPIPSSISILTNLDQLDLSHLTTTIDLHAILSYLKSISILDLSGTHVSCMNKSSVSDPPWQSSMHHLNLSSCGITDFPEILRTLQHMWFLDISNNKIKGQVPGWLWTPPELEYVNLSNNTFTSFQNSTNPGLSSVRYLFGSNNNFTGKIPSFVCSLRSLITLDLSNNNFNGSIPPCMGYLKHTLSHLNLRQNRLDGSLPEIVFRLRSLDVGHNQLVGKLPRSLVRFSNLEVLNVESNRINDTFPIWLSPLPELQVLVLRSNAFHGPIHQALFPKLKIIDVSHNHFNGTLPSNYFVNWSAMSSSLGTNEDQPDEKYIGDRKYGYYHDSMVLSNKGVEMELVRILKIYTALDFSGNKFEGEIPRSISLLKELHVLNLSNNAFTGHIPSSMGNLTALESLDVSQNKLSGAIPQELGNLSFLSYMNFSHNHLTGPVPGGAQFQTQKCSSFEDNLGLVGLSLIVDCRDIHTPASQQTHETQESEEEDDEEVLSWIAAAIGFTPGIVLGLTIGYILSCYRPQWFMNPIGRRNNL